MIRKVLLSMALGMSAGSALAADLPTMKGPAPFAAPPVFTWAGFYVGANIGYAWGSARTVTTLDLASSWGIEAVPFRDGWASLASGSRSATGVIGGLQAGYNWQMNQFVLGFEADLNAINHRASGLARNPAGVLLATGDTVGATRATYLATARARLGVAAFDRGLFYVTGGAAFTNLRNSVTDTCTVAPCSVNTTSGTRSTNVGWTLGAGLEYALTNNWSVKGEYLYASFKGGNFRAVNTGVVPSTSYNAGGTNMSLVRLGVNYRF